MYCGLQNVRDQFFAVQVTVCGAGVIHPKLKSRHPDHSDGYRRNECRNIQRTCILLIPGSLFLSHVNREPGHEATSGSASAANTSITIMH